MFSLCPVVVLLILVALSTPTAAVLGWDLSEFITVAVGSPADAAVNSNDGNETNSKDEVN